MLNKNRGFTLFEMIVATSLSLLLVGVAVTISLAGRNSIETGDIRIGLLEELRKAESWLIADLREAGFSTISNVPANGAWYDQITFKVPDGVAEGRVVWNSFPITYVLGGVNGDQLLRIQNNTARIVANTIDSFGVRRQTASPAVVEIALSDERSTVAGRVMGADLNFSVKLRN